jgi:hypothetical protein
MATIPVPDPGDPQIIVNSSKTLDPGNVVGPVTDGGGAAAVTVDVFNAQWTNAQSKARAAVNNLNVAIAYADPYPAMSIPPPIDSSYLPPKPPAISAEDPNRGQAIYDEALIEMLHLIEDSFVNFIKTYFPNMKYYEDAMKWCDDAIIVGGSGINPKVEAQLWQRDRARIFADSERAEDELTNKWANKRWPMPPGVLVAGMNQINLDAGRKLAESSRTTMIQSWKDELENVRFAVKTIVDQYKVALDAAGDYIRVIMLGPKTAMELATGLVGLQSQLNNALIAMYAAEVDAAKPQVQLAIASAGLQQDAYKANLDIAKTSMQDKVQAAMTAASTCGGMAAAGLNAVHAQAGIQGSDSTQIPWQGGAAT